MPKKENKDLLVANKEKLPKKTAEKSAKKSESPKVEKEIKVNEDIEKFFDFSDEDLMGDKNTKKSKPKKESKKTEEVVVENKEQPKQEEKASEEKVPQETTPEKKRYGIFSRKNKQSEEKSNEAINELKARDFIAAEVNPVEEVVKPKKEKTEELNAKETETPTSVDFEIKTDIAKQLDEDLLTAVIENKLEVAPQNTLDIEIPAVMSKRREVQVIPLKERKTTKFSDIYGKASTTNAGKVIALTNDVIDVEFGNGKTPQIGIILQSESDAILSVEAILDNATVRTVVISQNANVALGEKVYSTNKPLQAPVGEEVLGRLFNVFGQPIDGKELSKKQKFEDVEVIKKNIKKEFVLKDKRVATGIKVIDFFLPILEGDKMGMFGGAGVGKTLVIKEIINNLTTRKQNANSIFVGIGERSREGEELYRELYESNLIDKVALVFAQMNDTPGARMKVIYSSLTMAEYFRDVMKQNTYMFIDNVYRYIQAGSEISSSLGRINAQSGYQPTLATEVSVVQERIANSKDATITAFETVFVPADDITDPAVVAIFSHLDGSLVLDRKIAAEGKYPAISPLKSSSNNLKEEVVGKAHMQAVADAKRCLQRYDELVDLIAVLGQDSLSQEDKSTVLRARMLSNFFTQNFFVAEPFTQKPGSFVKIEDTIDGVRRIIDGEFDSLDPTNFLYISTVEELKQKLEDAKEIEKAKASTKIVTKKHIKKAEKIKKQEEYSLTQLIDLKASKLKKR